MSAPRISVVYLMNSTFLFMEKVTRWRSCLRHCTTNRMVAGSISDGVIGFFYWHNPSCHTMALGVDSACNRNEYQDYFLGVKYDRCAGLTTFRHSYAHCLDMWEPQPPGTSRACPGLYRVCFALLMEGSSECKWLSCHFDLHLRRCLHQTNAGLM